MAFSFYLGFQPRGRFTSLLEPGCSKPEIQLSGFVVLLSSPSFLQLTHSSSCRGCPSNCKTIQVFPLNWEYLLLGPMVSFRVKQMNLQHHQNDCRNLLGCLEHEEGYEHKTEPVGLFSELWGNPRSHHIRAKAREIPGLLVPFQPKITHFSSQLLQTPQRKWCVRMFLF